MATLIVPPLDDEPWPTLGPQVCDFLEEKAIHGPGDLKGQPARISVEKRAIIYRAYEVYPQGHELAGRRRFKRVGWSVRKGLAKTELLGWVSYAELHPEGPVRCDGFDADGQPVGRPVNSPYIPLLSYSKDQVEELAYGVLYVICSEGPDADLFDPGLDRILRWGESDSKAVPLAQSPNARDGARTTFQGFDEPHRMYLPRIIDAHETMANNLPKRPAADAWSFYVGTAGQRGQDSIAEALYDEALAMRDGRASLGNNPRFFFFHRDAGSVHRGDKDKTGHDLTTEQGLLDAIAEATGPEGEWGPGQFADIAEVYNRPKTDKGYWERVQLNLWKQADRQAFDPVLVRNAVREGETIQPGSLVSAGFDGARFRDSTAIVITDIASGLQQLWALWERPPDVEEWEIDPIEVSDAVDRLMLTHTVFRWNGDPAHYVEDHATWAGKYPCVEEFWTHRIAKMCFANRNYSEAIAAGAIGFADDDRPALNSPVQNETMGAALRRHVTNAVKVERNVFDDDGRRLWTIEKEREDKKIDGCMAGVLSWEARIAALQDKKLAIAGRRSGAVKRLY